MLVHHRQAVEPIVRRASGWAGDATEDSVAAAYDLAFHLTAKLPFPAARALNARAAAAREAPVRRR